MIGEEGEERLKQLLQSNQETHYFQNNKERGLFYYDVLEEEGDKNSKKSYSKKSGIYCGVIQMSWFNTVEDFLEYYYEVHAFIIKNYKYLYQKRSLSIDLLGVDFKYFAAMGRYRRYDYELKYDHCLIYQYTKKQISELLSEVFYRNMRMVCGLIFGRHYNDPVEDGGEEERYNQQSYLRTLILEDLQMKESFSDIFVDLYLRKNKRWKYWQQKMKTDTGPFRKWKTGDEPMYLGGWRDEFNRSDKKYLSLNKAGQVSRFRFSSFADEVSQRLRDIMKVKDIQLLVDSESSIEQYYQDNNI